MKPKLHEERRDDRHLRTKRLYPTRIDPSLTHVIQAPLHLRVGRRRKPHQK